MYFFIFLVLIVIVLCGSEHGQSLNGESNGEQVNKG